MSAPQKTAEERINDLEKKLDYIIEILGVNSLKNPKIDLDAPPPIPKTTVASKPQTATEVRYSSKTENNHYNLLPVLAVMCFFLAAIFIVKLTIESGWMTPARQWGLLTIFGIALTVFSLAIEKISLAYRSYAGAAGVVVLYIAAYSSYLYFGLLNPITSISIGVLISLLCLYLFDYFKSEIFIVVCVVGTYISPVLLNKDSDFIYLSAFFLLWAAVFSRIATFLETRTLPLLASYLGLGIFTFLNIEAAHTGVVLDIILVHSLQVLIYAGGVYYYSVKNQSPLSKEMSFAYLPILLFFYGTVYYFLNIYNPILAPWISLGFAAFVYSLYWQASKSNLKIESSDMIHIFIAVVLFHSGYIQLVPAEAKAWLLPLIILGLYVSEKKNNGQYGLSEVLKFMFLVIALLEFFSLCFKLMTDSDLLNVVPAFLTIIIGGIYYLHGGKQVKSKEEVFLALLHVISILSLYRIASDYGSLAVSLAWGIYSLVILGFGYFKHHAVIAKSSLVVLIVTTIKALIYDASQASSGNRIGSLILTGVILYGAGYLFQKINKWKVQ